MWMEATTVQDDDETYTMINVGIDKNGILWLREYSYDGESDRELAGFSLSKQEGLIFKSVCSYYWYDAEDITQVDEMIQQHEPGEIGQKEIDDYLDLYKMEKLL